MTDNELTPEEAAEIFGGDVGTIETNADELTVGIGLATMRDCIVDAAQKDGVGVNQLARRLGISPSSVSRFLSGEGDALISTMISYGRALGREWSFMLRRDLSCRVQGNNPHGSIIVINPVQDSSVAQTLTSSGGRAPYELGSSLSNNRRLIENSPVTAFA
jgi:transcriptional regulator with XRE-family HTH domain